MTAPETGERGKGEHAPVDPGDEGPHEDAAEATSFDLVRRVAGGLIRAVGEGAELVAASLAEELARFRLDVEHRVVVLLLMSAGGLLLEGAVLLFLRDLIGGWPLTLLGVGAAHVLVGLWLSSRWQDAGDSK